MEAPVGPQNWHRESSRFQQIIKKASLHLIKAFPDVSAATSDSLTGESGKLLVDGHEVPRVFSSTGRSGARKEFLFLP